MTWCASMHRLQIVHVTYKWLARKRASWLIIGMMKREIIDAGILCSCCHLLSAGYLTMIAFSMSSANGFDLISVPVRRRSLLHFSLNKIKTALHSFDTFVCLFEKECYLYGLFIHTWLGKIARRTHELNMSLSVVSLILVWKGDNESVYVCVRVCSKIIFTPVH